MKTPSPSAKSVPLAAAGMVFLVHLVANPHYGFFRDELYFIMCGLHPAWGYVDQPPLTPLLAAGSQLLGHSLVMLRAVPALFAAASVYVTCLIAMELGGGAFAQVFAALVTFLCPVLANFGMKVSTDTVGLLLWPFAAWCALRVLKGGNPRWWLLAGAALGLSFEAKYSVIFFAAALMAGILASPQRRSLLSPWCWGGVALAVALALPNVLWQAHYGFPMLELLRNGQHGKNVILGPMQFLVAEVLITNPLLALVWVSGLIWSLRNQTARFLGVTFGVLMVEMLLLHAKHYYPADIYPVLIACGAVAIEGWTSRMRWLRPALSAVALAAGLIVVPYALPVLPLDAFLAYHRVAAPLLHLEVAKTENHRDALLPQDWADMQGWRELKDAVAGAYATLSPAERENALIATGNYGEAAAIEFLGAGEGLPPVISGHNQYYLWGTHGRTGDVLIDVGGDCGQDAHLYQSSTLATTFSHPYVMPYEDHLPIRICRGINRPLAEFWPSTRTYR